MQTTQIKQPRVISGQRHRQCRKAKTTTSLANVSPAVNSFEQDMGINPVANIRLSHELALPTLREHPALKTKPAYTKPKHFRPAMNRFLHQPR